MQCSKAVVLAVVAAGLWIPPAMAQSTFGLKAGVVSSDAKWGSGATEQSAAKFTKKRSGMAGAAFLRLGGGAIALQIEGNYTEKGLKVDNGTTASGELVLTYIEVPALIRLSAPGKISPYVYGGAAAAFEMSCKVKGTASGTAYNSNCNTAASGSDTTRQKMDLTGIGGAGVQFALSSISVLVEARYALGLKTLAKTTNPIDVKNRALTFFGGVAFPMGGSGHRR